MDKFNDNWDGVSHKRLLREAATQQVIGKYRFNPFISGGIKGWQLSVQGKGEIGFIEEPAKKNTKTSVAPYKLYYFKEIRGRPDTELKAFFYPANETRIVDVKNVRYAPRQLLKSVAMWMDKYGHGMIGEEFTQQNAQTIKQQLGGGKFVAMTGAKDFIYSGKDSYLSFKIGKGAKDGINYIKVIYDQGRDDYTMEFCVFRGTNVKVKHRVSGVYADQLRSIFEKHTGLYTSLGTMK